MLDHRNPAADAAIALRPYESLKHPLSLAPPIGVLTMSVRLDWLRRRSRGLDLEFIDHVIAGEIPAVIDVDILRSEGE